MNVRSPIPPLGGAVQRLRSCWESATARTSFVVLAMCIAVSVVYVPRMNVPAHKAATAHVALLGNDFQNLHVRRLRYAREWLFGPRHELPGWYTRELAGTPFWSNLQNFPLIPTRLPMLLLEPENVFFPAVVTAA